MAQNSGWKRAGIVRRLYDACWPLGIVWGKCVVVRAYWRQMLKCPCATLRFLMLDPEVTNFTYDISNRVDLISFLSSELNLEAGQVRAMVAEIDSDNELRAELTTALRRRWDRKGVPMLAGGSAGIALFVCVGQSWSWRRAFTTGSVLPSY